MFTEEISKVNYSLAKRRMEDMDWHKAATQIKKKEGRSVAYE